MTDQEKINMSVFDVFASSQETFEEAKKKNSEESGKKVNYLRFSKDGTYSIRILPLAPVIDADGNALPMERKGYEYPLRSLMLKIEDYSHKDKKGNPKINYVTVCNAKYAYPALKADLIDTYLQTACDLYADDEKLCEKLRSGSFNGGLKWDSRRCMYVFDCDNRGDGLQILQLSFSQYKEVEDRKLNLWSKLLKKDPKAPCPICSIDGAYPVEVVRKTDKKTEYSFNIDTISGDDQLTQEDLQQLLDAPRLPEVLYRYTHYHLEATIAYLNQLDEKYGIEVMKEKVISDCIEQIKLALPADDQSHFTFSGGSDNSEQPAGDSIDSLWDRFDKLEDEGLDDKSAEGQELRTSIKEFIEDQELGIKITRSKSNQDLLNEIERAMSDGGDDEEADPEPEEKATRKTRKHADPEPEPEPEPDPEPEDEGEDDDEPSDAPESEDEDEEQDPEPEPAHSHTRGRERNDDTNEPAARPARRSARPARRR